MDRIDPRAQEPPRRRRATLAIETLLLLAAGVHGALGLAAALRAPTTPLRRLVPLSVDVTSDPPARLRLLPGIGPSRAAAIEEDRRRNGPVTRLEDLDRVRGIGPGIVENLREARGVRAVAGGAR